MAQALAQGIANSEKFAEAQVYFFDPSDESAEKFAQVHSAAMRCSDLESVTAKCQTLLLAVKPQIMPSVLAALKSHVNENHLVASVAAGIGIETYKSELNIERVVRVMPNTPCLIGKGMSGVAVSKSASESDRDVVVDLMSAVGQVMVVDESQLDAVTGMSGSGPAYVFNFIEALMDGGVACGLSVHQARMLAVQTVLGAAGLVESSSDQTPSELTAQVTSPGGTTLAGLKALEDGGFKKIVESAVIAARDRSIQLAAT